MQYRKNIHINDQLIKAGESKVINLQIARLISGTEIDLPIHVFRSKKPGPVVLLSGGLHGDEVNGIEIIRRIIESKVLNKLKCGSVIAIPVMNIYGFLNFSREVPDGKDINRFFPGNKKGSLAARVAYNLTRTVLEEIDFGIDFHTGGANRTNYPQIRYAPDDPKAKELADIFNAPVSLASKMIDKSIRKEVYKMGKSMIVYEGGESMRFDEFAIGEGINGALKVLNHFGMLNEETDPNNCHNFMNSSWRRARNSGMVKLEKESGAFIKKGELLAIITDPFADFKTRIKAKEDGFIIGHNNAPLVNQGDALFHIATP
jgi:predicted deacylase